MKSYLKAGKPSSVLVAIGPELLHRHIHIASDLDQKMITLKLIAQLAKDPAAARMQIEAPATTKMSHELVLRHYIDSTIMLA